MSAKTARANLKKVMLATLADETAHHTWTYHAVRPCPVPPSWKPGQRVWGDCSKGVQFLCRWAPGAPDPMGDGNFWGGNGNSQALWSHLPHLDHAWELQTGDVVTFGYNGDEHAAMCLEPGIDPKLWSFGHQGAPNTTFLSQDGRPHQFRRLMAEDPKPPPTEADKLRAKTGYFSWVAWRLGEGDWAAYVAKDPVVRPAVPAFISPEWWKRYARFLLNRSKAN